MEEEGKGKSFPLSPRALSFFLVRYVMPIRPRCKKKTPSSGA